jgi:hypothetical protein
MANLGAITRGLNIFLEYKPDGETWEVDAQHDVLFSHGPHPDALGGDHAKQLKDDGWVWSQRHYSWKIYT